MAKSKTKAKAKAASKRVRAKAVAVLAPAAEQNTAAAVEIRPGTRITFLMEAGRSHGGSIMNLRDRGRADIALDNGKELPNVPQAKDETEVGAWSLA